MKGPYDEFRSFFSDNAFLKKIGNGAKKIGLKTIYSSLLLYYAFRKRTTPLFAKHIIVGVLGYFIAPIDALPDFTPVVGYTDDMGVLAFGLVVIAGNVNAEVREKARNTIGKMFKTYDERALIEVDKKL